MLATAEVGRIGVSTRALPLIFPVCFAMDDDQIVISTQHGTTLDASTRDTVVAFEADGPSSHSSVGWSVQSTGIARHVTDPIELDRLAALALPSWSLKSPARFVTITTDQLSGRLAADTTVPFHHTHHRLSATPSKRDPPVAARCGQPAWRIERASARVPQHVDRQAANTPRRATRRHMAVGHQVPHDAPCRGRDPPADRNSRRRPRK